MGMTRVYLALAAAAAMLVGTTVLTTTRTVEARPLYKKTYEKVTDKKADCNVCHDAKDKKIRNDLGKKVEKELGAKDCKDEAKVEAAIKAATK